MHPFEVARHIESYGYTYTYWTLRNVNRHGRISALWMLWVGRQYNRHMAGKNILTDIVD
jgi:hypothetical protein